MRSEEVNDPDEKSEYYRKIFDKKIRRIQVDMRVLINVSEIETEYREKHVIQGMFLLEIKHYRNCNYGYTQNAWQYVLKYIFPLSFINQIYSNDHDAGTNGYGIVDAGECKQGKIYTMPEGISTGMGRDLRCV